LYSIGSACEFPTENLLVLTALRSYPLRHWFLTGLITVASWIVCETVGGLIFLACGIRLWSYHIAPVFWEITSLVGWIFVWLVAGNLIFFYLLWETRAGITSPWRWLFRAIFLMIAGPVNEVIWNTIIWDIVDTPLYLYTVLPTFDGSGSILSPLYYLTLLLGFWIEEQVPGTLARKALGSSLRVFRGTEADMNPALDYQELRANS
jgi:hypothetical protein